MHKWERSLNRFLRVKPRLGRDVYVARSAIVCGDVTLGEGSSVWYHAVLRGDINRIEVGHHTNIQDHSVVHLSSERSCVLGNYVTVGHAAILHACRVGQETLIGLGAVVLDGAVVGDQCLVGAKALITAGTRIPARSLVLGMPARVIRKLTPKEIKGLRETAESYAAYGTYCLRHKINCAPLGAGGLGRLLKPGIPQSG